MLRELILENFRNYLQEKIPFEAKPGITYLVGENAQGKTNILEAIYLLALGKSFRASSHSDLVQWDKEFARVKGVFTPPDHNHITTDRPADLVEKNYSLELFVGLPPQPKLIYKKNDVKISSSDFLGNCQIVFFHPEDLNMLYLGPDLRRRYLDIMNVQVKKEYFQALKIYKKVLAQRNALLRAIKEQAAERKDLQIWNEQLALAASQIYFERAKTLDFINKFLTAKYRNISKGEENLSIVYRNSFSLHAEKFGEFIEEELVKLFEDKTLLREKFLELLQKNELKDLQAQFTTIGPHRDDFEIFLKEKPLVQHASRGEYRSIVLALKMIEIDFFKSFNISEPILLLDDVFSELDHERQQLMLELAKEYQTIITTTKDSAILNMEKLIQGKFFEVQRGQIKNL